MYERKIQKSEEQPQGLPYQRTANYGKAVVNRVVRTKEIAKIRAMHRHRARHHRRDQRPEDRNRLPSPTATRWCSTDSEPSSWASEPPQPIPRRSSPQPTSRAMHVVYSPATLTCTMGKRIKSMLSGIKMEEMTEYNGHRSKENGGGTSGGSSDGGGNFRRKLHR